MPNRIKRGVTFFLVILIILSNSVTFANDDPSILIKTLESNLAKKVPVFKVKGSEILEGLISDDMEKKYRVKNYTCNYNKKIKTMTFKVSYNTGNQNKGKPDIVLKSEKQLIDYIFVSYRGMDWNDVVLVSNDTLDYTDDKMFIIKLDYKTNWSSVQNILTTYNYAYGDYNNTVDHYADTYYPHEALKMEIHCRYSWSVEEKKLYYPVLKSFLDKYSDPNIPDYEKIYRWAEYCMTNFSYDFEKFHWIEGEPNNYNRSEDKPLIIDKNGVCQDFAETTARVLYQLGVKSYFECIIGYQPFHEWVQIKLNNNTFVFEGTASGGKPEFICSTGDIIRFINPEEPYNLNNSKGIEIVNLEDFKCYAEKGQSLAQTLGKTTDDIIMYNEAVLEPILKKYIALIPYKSDKLLPSDEEALKKEFSDKVDNLHYVNSNICTLTDTDRQLDLMVSYDKWGLEYATHVTLSIDY